MMRVMMIIIIIIIISFSVYLFEELQLNGILEELSHGTGTMIHKGFLIECYRLTLKMQGNTPTVTAPTHYKFSTEQPWPLSLFKCFCCPYFRHVSVTLGRRNFHHNQTHMK